MFLVFSLLDLNAAFLKVEMYMNKVDRRDIFWTAHFKNTALNAETEIKHSNLFLYSSFLHSSLLE